MQLIVFAVGRMKKGPERELTDRYLDRLSKAGGQVGLTFGGVTEIAESRAPNAELRRAEESGKCLAVLDATPSALIVFDETGEHLSSEQFAGWLSALRDQGSKRLVLAIGGPDGHAPELLHRADDVMALGRLTWPHQLARLLIAEQLYRATTILSGHPYHRA